MKKELREPIKDPSIFENEYFKVVFRQHIKTLYVKCNKLTFSHIDSWVHNFDIEGFTIEEWHNNDIHGSAYEILPQRCHFLCILTILRQIFNSSPKKNLTKLNNE